MLAAAQEEEAERAQRAAEANAAQLARADRSTVHVDSGAALLVPRAAAGLPPQLRPQLHLACWLTNGTLSPFRLARECDATRSASLGVIEELQQARRGWPEEERWQSNWQAVGGRGSGQPADLPWALSASSGG